MSDAKLSDALIAEIIAGMEAGSPDMWCLSRALVRLLDPATILSAFTEIEASRVVMKQMAEALESVVHGLGRQPGYVAELGLSQTAAALGAYRAATGKEKGE